MTAREVEQLLKEGKRPPSWASLYEMGYYSTLCNLTLNFKNGLITKEQARKNIFNARRFFEEMQRVEIESQRAIKEWHDVLRKTAELRILIRRAPTIEEKCRHALECVRVMTGDVTVK